MWPATVTITPTQSSTPVVLTTRHVVQNINSHCMLAGLCHIPALYVADGYVVDVKSTLTGGQESFVAVRLPGFDSSITLGNVLRFLQSSFLPDFVAKQDAAYALIMLSSEKIQRE
jgi:hypothetical protein